MILEFKAFGLHGANDNFIFLRQRAQSKHSILGKREQGLDCKGLPFESFNFFGFYTCPEPTG